MKHWANFEDYIRELAGHIFANPCRPARVGGVDIDGVVDTDDDMKVLIEITVRKDLSKTREDIGKLVTAKNALIADGNIMSRSFCVIEGAVTNAMLEAAKPHNIKVLTAKNFAQIFFNFDLYNSARRNKAFGSAIDPLTGDKDDSEYVPVSYVEEATGRTILVKDIVKLLLENRHVVLLGEYGTGKSRCQRELYNGLSASADDNRNYPVAIDLREAWGLVRGPEIVRRHVDDLGIDTRSSASFIRALNCNSLTLLLDGFDELGSQSWSNDTDRLKNIRAKSLQGVKDLIGRTQSGVFICGREHYFNNNEEMFNALGLDSEDVVLLRCKDEFNEEETEKFFALSNADVAIPEWLPRRPLVCQTITNLSSDELDEMFGVGQNELRFFDHFMNVLCRRDARINAAFDPATIEQILSHLAQLTRSKSANVGPVTLTDVQNAFEVVVGQMPVDEAASMLQRLPALGRVKAESNDRQFIDEYILDGLRAKKITSGIKDDVKFADKILASRIVNPLNKFGQMILAEKIIENERQFMQFARRASDVNNPVIACDVFASALRTGQKSFDFNQLEIDDGNFLDLDMSECLPVNLRIKGSVISVLTLPTVPPPNTELSNCLAEQVIGVAAASGLPAWIKGLQSDRYDSIENTARIRKIGLGPGHEILVTVIRKTFFQKGAGRKEEALLRGLGQISNASKREQILNMLLKKRIISRFRGDEGWVYTPNRAEAGRMKKMLYELTVSTDEIWQEVGSF